MQPMVSRDLMQFPVALQGEGVIDMVVQSNVRLLLISRSEAETDPFHLDLSHAGTR
jgi:DNA polymerase III psi subunit